MIDPHPAITPLDIVRLGWPHVTMYDRQRETWMAHRESVETLVVAANQVGKDFQAGGIVLVHFLFPWVFYPPEYVQQVERFRSPNDDPHTRRGVTTSVKEDHLRVLWGEIGWWVRTCAWDLRTGPDAIVMLDKEMRFAREAGVEDKNLRNYVRGMVSAKGEGLAGHHAAYTQLVVDEASGMDDEVYRRGVTWSKRRLLFGNAEACDNIFKHHFRAGDLRT